MTRGSARFSRGARTRIADGRIILPGRWRRNRGRERLLSLIATAHTRTKPVTRQSQANPRLVAALVLLGAVVCALSVAFVADAAPPDAAVARGATAALVIALPILAGLYALRDEHNARLGLALLVAGFVWSLTALGEASESVAYSIGRVAGWLVFPSLIYLMAAFPDGRVAPGLDR